MFANTNLRKNEVWKTRDLLGYSLITSSNRGINSVARTITEKTDLSIVDLWENFKEKKGFVQTHLINSSGLDVNNILSGSESSAFDLAKIAGIIIEEHPDLAAETIITERNFYSLDGTEYTAKNTNYLLSKTDRKVKLSKTGYTDIAGGALIMVLEVQNENIAFVVLNSTKTGRFEDMNTLFLIFDSIQNK